MHPLVPMEHILKKYHYSKILKQILLLVPWNVIKFCITQFVTFVTNVLLLLLIVIISKLLFDCNQPLYHSHIKENKT